MSDEPLVAVFRKYPPLVVTLDELKAILMPITVGYAWGESTIKDLWTLGAPTPDSGPGKIEKRIVFPGQLAKWLADVLEKQGQPLDDAAKIYIELQELSR